MKNIYALLIGINDYSNAPLTQCIHDVAKIKNYCKSLNNIKGTVNIITLLDKQATKKNIPNQLKQILSGLKEKDTFLFYFSGHGAQEGANNRFPEEQDNLLECLVCYHEKEQSSNYLLADKEIRYLLNACKTKANIVTIFDCCHSGDMVRSDIAIKRLVNVFPARPYEEFLFAKSLSEEQLKAEGFTKNIPFINSIHIAACQSNQSAWEKEHGGVFTHYLLKLLKESHSHLSYQFITQWIKINIRDNTMERQVPTISVQGEGNLKANSSWLGLYPDEELDKGLIFYKEAKGWMLNRGVFFGISKEGKIAIKNDRDVLIDGTIKEVGLEDAQVQFFEEEELDTTKVYPIDTISFYYPLKLYLSNLQQDGNAESRIQKIIEENKQFQLVAKEECDFQLVLSNHLIYITLSSTPSESLTDPISSDLRIRELRTTLLEDLLLLRKWNHFYKLQNEQQNRQAVLIQVELIEIATEKVVDITNDSHTLFPYSERGRNGEWYSKYKIKVSNKTNRNLHVAVLTLGSDLSISSRPFNNQCILLSSGQSKFFYDHLSKPIALCSLDGYKEAFNWEKEWFHYQFLVNDLENISTSIPFFLQGAISPDTRGIIKRKNKNKVGTWAVYTSTIYLQNPSYTIDKKTSFIEHKIA